jgi:hypothetical protein
MKCERTADSVVGIYLVVAGGSIGMGCATSLAGSMGFKSHLHS